MLKLLADHALQQVFLERSYGRCAIVLQSCSSVVSQAEEAKHAVDVFKMSPTSVMKRKSGKLSLGGLLAKGGCRPYLTTLLLVVYVSIRHAVCYTWAVQIEKHACEQVRSISYLNPVLGGYSGDSRVRKISGTTCDVMLGEGEPNANSLQK